jgi:hypothetical protein
LSNGSVSAEHKPEGRAFASGGMSAGQRAWWDSTLSSLYKAAGADRPYLSVCGKNQGSQARHSVEVAHSRSSPRPRNHLRQLRAHRPLDYRLGRDLPLVAERCDSCILSSTQRARMGRGFADMMLRGRHIEQDGPW